MHSKTNSPKASVGFHIDRRIVASWPMPTLSDDKPDSVAMPYCDNLTVLGNTADASADGLNLLLGAFVKAGFDMHEVSVAEPRSNILGYSMGGGQ